MHDILIIGAGVTGACIARELSKYDLDILVLEKNNDVADETTKANSAIIHAGFDAREGTLMAELNVLGNSMFDKLSKELDFPFIRNGSLVLAFSDEDMESIKVLKNRGDKNGVSDLSILSKEEALKLEPDLNNDIKGALYAKTGGIVGPWEMTISLFENAVDNGVTLLLNNEIVNISREENHFLVFTKKSWYKSKIIINCAGINADLIQNMLAEPSYEIHPRKGEYFVMSKDEGTKFRHTIFQPPTKVGKGVLITPTVHGNLLIGPDAERIHEKEDKSTSRVRLELIKATAAKSSQNINYLEQIRQFSGLRAESDKDDFIIGENKKIPGFIDVAGIKSPGLSAAPAIALKVKDILAEKIILKEKKNFKPDIEKHIILDKLSYEEKNKLIAKNPKYGHIICKCENVTEGEVIDAIRRKVGARTVDGIKRRCRPGAGLCQGTFCGPKIQEILASELALELNEITLDSDSSYILTKKTKGDK